MKSRLGNCIMMKKIKLGEVLDVKRGTSLSGKYYKTEGDYIRLTLGNFNYPSSGWKENKSKDNLYYDGPITPEYIMSKGDIITPLTEQVRGLLGNTATVPEDNLYIQSGDIGKVIPHSDVLYGRFAYYLISSRIVKKQLDACAQQTKIRHTSPDKIKNCAAFIPDKISEQIKIASILDAINSKIELNNRINDNLQQLARMIYNQQFKSSSVLYSDGETCLFCNFIKNITTGLNPRNHFKLTNNGYSYITVKNLTISGELNFNDCDHVDSNAATLIQNRANVSAGDILFSSIAPLGRCHLVLEEPKDWVINESVFCIKPITRILQYYLYFYLTSKEFVKKAESSSTGSIFNGIRISTLNNMKLKKPNEFELISFNEKVEPLLKQIENNNVENLKLNSLRDFLLPLLMNGQSTID